MINIKVTVEYNDFEDIGLKIIQNLDDIVEGTANRIEERAIQLMETSPATGRTYRRPGGGEHHASAPYEPPAVYEGDLIASSFVRRVGLADFEVGFTDRKASWLEYGTPKMLPRPFLIPAVFMEKIRFYKEVSEAFNIIR